MEMSSIWRKENPCLEFITFNLDIELCGWLLSLYQCGCGYNVFGTYQERESIVMANSFGVIHELAPKEYPTTHPVSGKVTTVLVVVGIGSLLCYRLLKLVKHLQVFSFSKSPPDDNGTNPPVATQNVARNAPVKTCYFGPTNNLPFEEKYEPMGKRNDSSGESDCSPCLNSRTRNRRLSKHYRNGSLFNKLHRYITLEHFGRGRTEDGVASTDSSLSPAILSVKREGSIDSICSDLSLDLSGIVDPDSSTVARMDLLQQEIELLKSNCLSMDEEFETIKTNRNMPGLSSLMETTQEDSNSQTKESARECFKGLYSLTTINRSMSFDLSGGTSTDGDSPIHKELPVIPFLSEEGSSFSSLEWDSHDASSFVESPIDKMETSGYTSVQSSIIGNDSYLPMDEHSWGSDSYDQLIDSNDSFNQFKGHSRNGSDTSIASSKINNASPVIFMNNNRKENIGAVVPILEFKKAEFEGRLDEMERYNSGYNVIYKSLGFTCVRHILDDNYTGIRAPLFEVLSRGLPITSGQEVINQLMEAVHSNERWLCNWNFANQLPFTNHSFVRGMQICLTTLDNVVSLLKSSDNRAETLATLMNTDPTLDVHLMEAIKLHMVSRVLRARRSNFEDNVCLKEHLNLALGDRSSATEEYLCGYLQLVGTSRKMQKMELTLLGFTLGVILQVIRPHAFGSSRFIKYYPETSFNWPSVTLICGIEKSYNILCTNG